MVAIPLVSIVATPLKPPFTSEALTPEIVKLIEVPGVTPVVVNVNVATEPSLTVVLEAARE
jgi:hypothetical protein